MPALTFGVSTNFALANFLASRSFGNVLVALTRFRFPRGSSNETYHVPLDLLAMIPSRGLRRRLTDRGRDLNRRLTKSFRLPPASPQDSFSSLIPSGHWKIRQFQWALRNTRRRGSVIADALSKKGSIARFGGNREKMQIAPRTDKGYFDRIDTLRTS